MNRKETWGIPFTYILDFFSNQPDVLHIENGSFQFENCRIHIVQLPDSDFGSLRLPRTSVEFSGETDDLEHIYHRFFMKFLSAGG